MFIAYLATDNKYIGFFGEYQRRTGLLSYSCLGVFFLTAVFILRLNSIFRLEVTMIGTGFIVGTYSLSQHYGYDFIHWNNPYNSILGTLGNPDFAAAVLSIFFIISIGGTVQKKYSPIFKIFCGMNSILIMAVIYFSRVRQGLLTALIGCLIILVVWTHQRNKVLAYAITILSVIFALVALGGMLNRGPLIKYFYKTSVTFRGDYWRAGWQMFRHHPILGVGLDRYGAYFRQYRDSTQSLRRGPDLVSNAAHSMPIQFAATGGSYF